MAIRQMTGSANLIQLVNNFGHCASHSTTLRHDTALATLNLQSSTVVPKEILPGKNSILIWDNDDFKEEARASTHITNGIIVQKVHADDKISVPSIPKSRQKALPNPQDKILPFTIGKKKSLDIKSQCTEMRFEENNHIKPQISANRLDLLYSILNIPTSSDQEFLPDWTGFNTLISENELTMSRVGYLPIIEGSPTEYSTVFTVLVKSLEIATKLSLQHIVIVFDEAIYAKAQQIRWKNEDFISKTVIRLGDFHAVMSFCGAISKLFRDAGLQVCIYSYFMN